jgi:16S rRNA U1498 N3-methylase RsmE
MLILGLENTLTKLPLSQKRDVNILSLGDATLRAETAAIVASTLFLL